MNSAPSQPYTLINQFTIRPGQLPEFLRVQREGLEAMRGQVPGLLGGRLYGNAERGSALMVSVFESEAAFQRFLASPIFTTHRSRLAPLLEKTDPSAYQLAYANGVI